MARLMKPVRGVTPARPASAPEERAVPRRDAEYLVGVKLCRRKHNKHNRTSCERAARAKYAKKASKTAKRKG